MKVRSEYQKIPPVLQMLIVDVHIQEILHNSRLEAKLEIETIAGQDSDVLIDDGVNIGEM